MYGLDNGDEKGWRWSLLLQDFRGPFAGLHIRFAGTREGSAETVTNPRIECGGLDSVTVRRLRLPD